MRLHGQHRPNDTDRVERTTNQATKRPRSRTNNTPSHQANHGLTDAEPPNAPTQPSHPPEVTEVAGGKAATAPLGLRRRLCRRSRGSGPANTTGARATRTAPSDRPYSLKTAALPQV